MLKDALKYQLTFIDGSLQMNLKGIDNEDALRGATEGGNSINWVLGHMINTRGTMMKILGAEPVTGSRYGDLYGRHTKPVGAGDDHESLEALRAAWAESQAALLGALEAADGAQLETMVPGRFTPEEQESTGVQLAGLVFHEAYHAGQIGVIRRNLGMVGAID